jgi:hypothetical protein
VPFIQRTFSSSERLECWCQQGESIAREQFTQWAKSGEPVPLFRAMSTLVMTLLIYFFTGPEFAGKHVEELVPMVQAFERAMQKPQTRALPRWMSHEGRLMDYAESRMKVLIDEEVRRRLKAPQKYENNMDYLQEIVNTVGGKYSECISTLDFY